MFVEIENNISTLFMRKLKYKSNENEKAISLNMINQHQPIHCKRCGKPRGPMCPFTGEAANGRAVVKEALSVGKKK